jgi:hypothetical protein
MSLTPDHASNADASATTRDRVKRCVQEMQPGALCETRNRAAGWGHFLHAGVPMPGSMSAPPTLMSSEDWTTSGDADRSCWTTWMGYFARGNFMQMACYCGGSFPLKDVPRIKPNRHGSYSGKSREDPQSLGQVKYKICVMEINHTAMLQR